MYRGGQRTMDIACVFNIDYDMIRLRFTGAVALRTALGRALSDRFSIEM